MEREAFQYQAQYCEENIWHLCQSPHVAGELAHVAFVSNREACVALRRQRLSQREDGVVVWDYHVILIAGSGGTEWMIWDLDTTLPLPCEAHHYLRESFDCLEGLGAPPAFRLISAEAYVAGFWSDRRHMATQRGPIAAPPSWPPIMAGSLTLERLLDFDADADSVLDMESLRQRLGGRPRQVG